MKQLLGLSTQLQDRCCVKYMHTRRRTETEVGDGSAVLPDLHAETRVPQQHNEVLRTLQHSTLKLCIVCVL